MNKQTCICHCHRVNPCDNGYGTVPGYCEHCVPSGGKVHGSSLRWPVKSVPSQEEEQQMFLKGIHCLGCPNDTCKGTTVELVGAHDKEVREQERERIWQWAVNNGITDKKSFIALRNFLQDNKPEE